jgi:hypothetical protein
MHAAMVRMAKWCLLWGVLLSGGFGGNAAKLMILPDTYLDSVAHNHLLAWNVLAQLTECTSFAGRVDCCCLAHQQAAGTKQRWATGHLHQPVLQATSPITQHGAAS